MRIQRMSRFSGLKTVLIRAAFVLTMCHTAQASPITWDLLGNYQFGYYVQLGDGSISLNVTGEDFSTGALTATTSTPNTTLSDAYFDGTDLTFDATFVGLDSFGSPLTCDYVFDGAISTGGTFSGDMGRNCAGHGFFTGSFGTDSGQATQRLPAIQILEYQGSDNCPNLPSGSTGCFAVINNTNDDAVTGFAVGNSDALADSTTRANWSAIITSVNFGAGLEPTFEYFDQGGPGFNPITYGSDASFFYTTLSAGSPFEVFATGPNGNVGCIGTTGGSCDPDAAPEPSSLALAGIGFAVLCWMLRSKWALGRNAIQSVT